MMRVFQLPDGREIYVDPRAVSCVYDQAGCLPEQPSSVIAVGTQAIVVPYTAAQVMDILQPIWPQPGVR